MIRFFQFFKHFWFPPSVGFLLLKSLKIFTVGKILYLSADHHAGWPLCKLWEHRARSIQPKFRPVRLRKEDHLKRWTSFFETFPVGPNRSIEFRTEISGILVEWIAPIISRSQTSSLVSPPKFKTRKGILSVHAPYTTSPFEISWRSRTIGAVTLAILPIGKWLLSTGNNVLCLTQKNVKKTKYLGSFQGKFYGLIRTQCR